MEDLITSHEVYFFAIGVIIIGHWQNVYPKAFVLCVLVFFVSFSTNQSTEEVKYERFFNLLKIQQCAHFRLILLFVCFDWFLVER